MSFTLHFRHFEKNQKIFEKTLQIQRFLLGIFLLGAGCPLWAWWNNFLERLAFGQFLDILSIFSSSPWMTRLMH